MNLAAKLRAYAADLDAAGPQYAGMVEILQRAADGQDALAWIASQPIMGPAANWWDMRARAREALGLPPVMLSPEERGHCPSCED